MLKVLECPHCARLGKSRGLFSASIVNGANADADADDTHNYIELNCANCHKPAMHFVVDLIPEFER
jgi:hypothetical protein